MKKKHFVLFLEMKNYEQILWKYTIILIGMVYLNVDRFKGHFELLKN